jgi:alpha-tubulin suppressor-like RCC1 family protein
MKKSLQLLVITLVFSSNLFSQSGTGCWRQISSGQNFSLAIKMDGTLWGWGQNGNLLGLNGNMTNQNLPIQIGTANDWATVSAGNVHSLAVKTNGTLWAWGNGQFGQLGNGVFNSATWTVTQVGTANDWLSVSAGNRFSIAIKTTGTLWSWGLNNTGQLGLNNLVDQNIPVQVGTATNWSKIDAGNQHALAIDNSGFVYGWGNNTFGQLGNGTNTTSLFPIMISTSNNWAEVSAGLDHSMVLNTSGNLFTFGNNTNGQLCDGTNISSNVFVPIGFNSDGTVSLYIVISAGNSFSLVLKNDSTFWSSGINSQGQLGLGNNTNTNLLNQVGTSNSYFALSAGDTHSLALDTTTSLFSTGRGLEGELAIGTNVAANTLQTVSCTTTLSNQTVTLKPLNINISPNPTNDYINLNYNLENASQVTLKLTNIQGQVILENKIEKANGLQNDTLYLSNQASGLYILTITTETGIFSAKVMKR